VDFAPRHLDGEHSTARALSPTTAPPKVNGRRSASRRKSKDVAALDSGEEIDVMAVQLTPVQEPGDV
jgi:hypothetical protein